MSLGAGARSGACRSYSKHGGGKNRGKPPLPRRTVLQTAAAATATTALTAPFVHGAFAAGSLSLGFWDHWVPGANDTLTKLCKEWGATEQVDVQIDYITSQGDK